MSDNATLDASHPVAVVTGGAGDIGRAIGAALAHTGHQVVLADIVDDDAGSAAVETVLEASPTGSAVVYVRMDTTDSFACTETLAALPRLDVVAANAGMVHSQPFLDIAPTIWRRHLEVNLTGAFVVAQAAARRMVHDGTHGSIVFTSSWVATRPWPGITAYSSTKAGIEQLMRQAALELSPYRIRANAVAPGIVRAGMAKHQLDTEPDYAARAATAVPLGELQTADQIGSAVAFLASASGVDGTVLVVDAGSSLGTLD